MSQERKWSRVDAERRIGEVFDGAKAGNIQIVQDSDGSYEVRFISGIANEKLGSILSRGGPDDR
jgi:hypothetical protein